MKYDNVDYSDRRDERRYTTPDSTTPERHVEKSARLAGRVFTGVFVGIGALFLILGITFCVTLRGEEAIVGYVFAPMGLAFFVGGLIGGKAFLSGRWKTGPAAFTGTATTGRYYGNPSYGATGEEELRARIIDLERRCDELESELRRLR